MQKKLTIEASLLQKLDLERLPHKHTTEWSLKLKKEDFNVENSNDIIQLLQVIEDSLPFFKFSAIRGNFYKEGKAWQQATTKLWQEWCETSEFNYDSSLESLDIEIVIRLSVDLVLQDENQQLITLKDWSDIYFIYDNRPDYQEFVITFRLYAPSVLFENEKYKEHNLNILSKGFKKLRKKLDAKIIIDNLLAPLDKDFLGV
jgi:hypothetical protein